MSNAPGSDEEDVKPDYEAAKKAAFSPHLDKIKEALELLYLKGNPSGRNKFGEIYKETAFYIFGEELIKYDHEGCNNWDHRSELEESALQRRFELLKMIDELQDKSVDSGTLQVDYVSKIIDHFGIGVCQYLYAENIIERVKPGLLKTLEQEKDDAKETKARPEEQNDDKILQDAEREILASKPKDTSGAMPNLDDELDDIKPIDTQPQSESQAQEAGETSGQEGEDGDKVARQSIEIGGGSDGDTPPALDSEHQAPKAAPEKQDGESGPAGNPAPPISEEDKPSAPLAPKEETAAPQAPSLPSSDASQAPPLPEKQDAAPSVSGGNPAPDIKENTNKAPETQAVAKKPDFMNIKSSEEKKPEEVPKVSYRDLFNKLATKPS